MSERFKELVLKTSDSQEPRVRIPSSPPFFQRAAKFNKRISRLSFGVVLKWVRGAPATGVGRVTGARVQISPTPPGNDKFRQKLVVFSYIRLTASYMHLRCVIFASQVICLRALGANIISLKPQVSISHFA